MIIYLDNASKVTFETASIIYDDMTTQDGPISPKNLLFSYEFQITARQTFEKLSRIDKMKTSKTGMCLNLIRSSHGGLDSGYYYPMTAFALLSMISYLINPDVVSWLKQSYLIP